MNQALTNIAVKSDKHNKPIVTDVFYKKTGKQKPIVIFCHGYKGYKDWGAWNLMVDNFIKENLFFVKFNFSHNGGTLENPIDFPDLEAFGRNNFSLELDDLETVINWLLVNEEFAPEINTNDISLIGHSRGGGIVALKSFENHKIKKVVSWSGVSDFGSRFPSGLKLWLWRLKGKSYILNARTKQKMPHYFQFYKNFKQNEHRLTISSAVKSLRIPHLIVHGGQDVVVPLKEAENLHKWNPRSNFHVVAQMDHALGCSQPYLKPEIPEFLKEVVEVTIEFLKQSDENRKS